MNWYRIFTTGCIKRKKVLSRHFYKRRTSDILRTFLLPYGHDILARRGNRPLSPLVYNTAVQIHLLQISFSAHTQACAQTNWCKLSFIVRNQRTKVHGVRIAIYFSDNVPAFDVMLRLMRVHYNALQLFVQWTNLVCDTFNKCANAYCARDVAASVVMSQTACEKVSVTKRNKYINNCSRRTEFTKCITVKVIYIYSQCRKVLKEFFRSNRIL